LKDEGKYFAGIVKDTAFEALYKISRRLGMRILKEQEDRKMGKQEDRGQRAEDG
jgi:hypothetical protein